MSTLALSLDYAAISPWAEMGAYEFLWTQAGQTFKRISENFRQADSRPSDFVLPSLAEECAREATDMLHKGKAADFGIRLNGMGDYPIRLRDAQYPVELLYFQGLWDLAETPSIAIVGTRIPSDEGKLRAGKLARRLVSDGYTVVSGLAAGIDTAAHEAAIACGGSTIAVIGTPLSRVYPLENEKLQARIAKEHLLISQVPVLRYSRQDWRHNRSFFPQRNITMSALTQATIIVEASDTSGTLMQAQAAIHQKRKLFILDSCFRNTSLTWPARYESQGAIRVREYEDIKRHLGEAPQN
jgi:DNA processing protein